MVVLRASHELQQICDDLSRCDELKGTLGQLKALESRLFEDDGGDAISTKAKTDERDGLDSDRFLFG